MAVSGRRCCGGEWIGCTCTPSGRNARDSAATRRLTTLSAVCFLALVVHVATARAEDAPQPPVVPTIPTIAVQVSVSVPAVSVHVQAGTVDISVSTASVDVSVSASSEHTSSTTEAVVAPPQQTTQNDTPSDCCSGEANEVAPPASAKTRAPRAVAPETRPRPTRAAADAVPAVPARTIRAPHVGRSRRLLAATQVPRRTSARRVAPKARPECCDDAKAGVGAAAGKRPARAWPRPDSYDAAQVLPAAPEQEPVRDNRLLLQLGVLAAFLYLMCLAGWFSATSLRRRRA